MNKYHLKNLFIKITRDKNNIFFIILLVISTIMLIGSITFNKNFNEYIEENINKNINFRVLSVSNKQDEADLGKEELLSIEHVQDVYSSVYGTFLIDSNFANEDLDGKITPQYLPKSTVIHSLIGSQIGENDTGVAIIPKDFYPDNSVYEYNINDKNIIDGESLIGKEFTITYYTRKFENMKFVDDEKLTKTFKVIGVYDNKEFMNYNNDIFISQIDIDEIAKAKIPKNDNPDIEITQIDDYSFNVVVDSLENVESVTEKILEHNFSNVEPSMEIDEGVINTIKISCLVIAIISIAVIILIVLLYMRKKLIRESNYIGILRASGYTKTNVTIQYLFETIITSIIKYIIVCILLILLCVILKNIVFNSFNYIGYNIRIFSTDFIIGFVILILTSSISSLYMIHMKLKSNIINLIESRE